MSGAPLSRHGRTRVRLPRIKRVDGAIPLKASGGKRPHRVREYGSKALAVTLEREDERQIRQSARIGRHLVALLQVLDLRRDELPLLIDLLHAGAKMIRTNRL